MAEFFSSIHSILISKNENSKKEMFSDLKKRYFMKTSSNIDKHWEEDLKKVKKLQIESQIQLALSSYISLGVFSLLLVSVFFIRNLIKKKAIEPIQEISRVSFEMAKGNLDREIKIKSKDELEELAKNFNLMARTLSEKLMTLQDSINREQRVVRELAILNDFVGYASSETEFEVIKKMKKIIQTILFIFSALLFSRLAFAVLSQEVKDMALKKPVLGVEVSKAQRFEDLIEKLSDKKIIYVGEQHDRYEHHLIQLEVIKALKDKGHDIAIGMEMFNYKNQKALDDYIAGNIDEKVFLKKSQYFKTWGFDYVLYRDILEFARENKIPVRGLNISREIVNKVARSGIESLSEEEKKELPAEMDMGDEEYKKRLKEAFERHEGSDERDFERFYQSQIIWDEIMAQRIDEYLKENPSKQMVVIVGSGHLTYSSGIPKRAFRRNGLPYVVILNNEDVFSGIADYIFYPEPVSTPDIPKLMTLLKDDDEGVRIIGFPEKSISEKAGLRVDDIIVSIDGERVQTAEDIKILLLYKKKGDKIKVDVLRKVFLFGKRLRQFEVTL